MKPQIWRTSVLHCGAPGSRPCSEVRLHGATTGGREMEKSATEDKVELIGIQDVCNLFPECEHPDVIKKKWNVAADAYDYKKCCYHHSSLKNQMSELAWFLNANNITYFVDGGTLLGMERHRSLIPWDSDM